MGNDRDKGNDRDVQKADPALRRVVLVLLGIAALASVAAVLRLESYLQELQELSKIAAVAAAERVVDVVGYFLLAIAAGATVLAWILGRLSWRTIASQRYPPPGSRVISDTRILRHRAARTYGWTGLLLSVLLLIAGIAVPYWIHRQLERSLTPGLQPTRVSPSELGFR